MRPDKSERIEQRGEHNKCPDWLARIRLVLSVVAIVYSHITGHIHDKHRKFSFAIDRNYFLPSVYVLFGNFILIE